MERSVVPVRRLVRLAALTGVLFVLYRIFEPFVSATLWAAILVLTTYPLYRIVLRRFPRRPKVAAFLMTSFVGLVILVLVLPVVIALSRELDTALEYVNELKEYAATAGPVRARTIPLVGPQMEAYLSSLGTDDQLIADLVNRYRGQLVRILGSAFRGAAYFFLQFILCLFVAFFLYVNGRHLGAQLLRAGDLIGGGQFSHVIRSMREMVRAVVYGMFFTALVQGVLAGFGYAAVGAPVPLLLSFLTMLASLIPFGTPFVYLPVAIAVVIRGAPIWYGMGLALWGVCVVSLADNVVRPLFISQATNLPVMLVFFAVLGGVMSFGLLGVFVGPVFVAVGLSLWNEFISEKPSTGARA